MMETIAQTYNHNASSPPKIIDILNFILHVNREILIDQDNLRRITSWATALPTSSEKQAYKNSFCIGIDKSVNGDIPQSRSPSIKDSARRNNSTLRAISSSTRGQDKAYHLNLGAFPKKIKEVSKDEEVIFL
jgi:hypothetical protein